MSEEEFSTSASEEEYEDDPGEEEEPEEGEGLEEGETEEEEGEVYSDDPESPEEEEGDEPPVSAEERIRTLSAQIERAEKTFEKQGFPRIDFSRTVAAPVRIADPATGARRAMSPTFVPPPSQMVSNPVATEIPVVVESSLDLPPTRKAPRPPRRRAVERLPAQPRERAPLPPRGSEIIIETISPAEERRPITDVIIVAPMSAEERTAAIQQRIVPEPGELPTHVELRGRYAQVAGQIWPDITPETAVILGNAALNKAELGVKYDARLDAAVTRISEAILRSQ